MPSLDRHSPTPAVRYRFGSFVVSPRQRTLLRDGGEVPLIPRYFDLLVLLLERRHEAVHRQVIFDTVWHDVIVSDGALSQAVRTLRRALGDDSREPVFIRTVARHGYRFVCPDVIEEPDAAPAVMPPARAAGADEQVETEARFGVATHIESVDGLVRTLVEAARGRRPLEEGRDAAERLHAIGTGEALAHLGSEPGHARARAILRDARWDVPGADAVPLLGTSDGWRAAWHLVRLRLERAWWVGRRRWASAVVGGAAAGAIAGAIGGSVLAASPGADAPWSAAVVLGLIGATAGAVGAGGIGAGLAAAESLARSRRGTALVACGGAGGALAGGLAHLVVRWTLDSLFGLRLPAIGGPWEGLTIGAAAGLGYAIGAPRPVGGGLVTPHGRARVAAVLLVAACCAGAGLGLAVLGHPMVGGLVNAIAQVSKGSAMALAPLGALLGEPEFGPVSRMLASAFEGALFGAGLAFGATSRPRS